ISERNFLAPRGSILYGRRNLGGKNRAIDFSARGAPRPTTSSSDKFGFLEYRVASTYREPRAFKADTDLVLGVVSEQAVRTGFNFARKTGALQMSRRVTNRVSVTGRY